MRATGPLTTLSPDDAARLRSLPATYPTRPAPALDGPPPDGARTFSRSAVIGRGRACFERAADAALGWQVQRRAGLAVAASHPRVDGVSPDEPDAVVAALTIRLGPLRVLAPCRIVEVISERDHRGFGYGTLPGHPEAGAEWFVVSIGDDDVVHLTVTAYSRPATRLARLVPVATSLVQDLFTRRYLRALADR